MDAARRMRTPAVVWFRRDLRLHDHPALTDALTRHAAVVPLFVLDPRLLHGRFASPNRTWFLLGSLRALDADLRERGARLHVRVGDPRTVVPVIALDVGASDVYVSRDPSPYGWERDRVVAETLAAGGVGFHPKRGVLVHEPDEVLTQRVVRSPCSRRSAGRGRCGRGGRWWPPRPRCGRSPRIGSPPGRCRRWPTSGSVMRPRPIRICCRNPASPPRAGDSSAGWRAASNATT